MSLIESGSLGKSGKGAKRGAESASVCRKCFNTGYVKQKERVYLIPGNPREHYEFTSTPCPKGCLGKLLS